MASQHILHSCDDLRTKGIIKLRDHYPDGLGGIGLQASCHLIDLIVQFLDGFLDLYSVFFSYVSAIKIRRNRRKPKSRPLGNIFHGCCHTDHSVSAFYRNSLFCLSIAAADFHTCLNQLFHCLDGFLSVCLRVDGVLILCKCLFYCFGVCCTKLCCKIYFTDTTFYTITDILIAESGCSVKNQRNSNNFADLT